MWLKCHGNYIQGKSRLVDCQDVAEMSRKLYPGGIQACRLQRSTTQVTEIKSGGNPGLSVAKMWLKCHGNYIRRKSRLVDCQDVAEMSRKLYPGGIQACRLPRSTTQVTEIKSGGNPGL